MLAMNCASQISIVLALLGFLAVEAASRSSAVRDRHCSLVTDVPAQVLQFVPPEKEDSKSSRERTDPTNGSLQKKSGDKQETLNCTHKSMLVQGSLREDGKRILGKTPLFDLLLLFFFLSFFFFFFFGGGVFLISLV